MRDEYTPQQTASLEELQKRCNVCGEEKPLTMFHRDPRGKHGVRSTCKECHKARYRQYYAENTAKERARTRKYCAENAEAIREWTHRYYLATADRRRQLSAKYRAENREEVRRKNRERLRANPQKRAANERNRHARKRAAEGSHTVAEVEQLVGLCGDRCLRCGESYGNTTTTRMTIDHIVPLAAGGRNSVDNLQPLCQSCNCAKNKYSTEDYRPAHVREWAAAASSGEWRGGPCQ